MLQILSTIFLILWSSILLADVKLIDYSSPEGIKLLRHSMSKNTLLLLSQFTTQKTLTYCGVASAVTVLNAMKQCAPTATEYPNNPYFTQDNFFNGCVTHIAQPQEVSKRGFPLNDLARAIACHGPTVMTYSSKDLNESTFREILHSAIERQDFVIINFSRTKMDQQGGGHFSPAAAYDSDTDRFLILDTARYKYQPYWVKTHDIWRSTVTCDHKQSRGFIIVKGSHKNNYTKGS